MEWMKDLDPTGQGRNDPPPPEQEPMEAPYHLPSDHPLAEVARFNNYMDSMFPLPIDPALYPDGLESESGRQTEATPESHCLSEDWQLPPIPEMPEGRQDPTPSAEMTSVTVSLNSGGKSSNQSIPLVCIVCPSTPRFSDVSHLLTHVSSKGHLHHEAQLKLRARQDIASSVTLDQYNDWYKKHGIGDLLLKRMEAKKSKDDAKTKRSRESTAATARAKKKPRRPPPSAGSSIKLEREERSAYHPYPPHFLSDHEYEVPKEDPLGSDSLSLKGQVWPGMGKIDLANDEMKRTRNQRKPKSAIDRMRRTSESIEPIEVVYNADFEIERIKGVYDDSSSPAPGQEESSPPRKTTRSKRRRGEALASLPPNVPRTRQSARNHSTREPTVQLQYGHQATPGLPVPVGSLRQSDVFRDNSLSSAACDHRAYAPTPQQETGFEVRDHLSMPTLNPISHSNLASPTPSARGIPTYLFAGNEASRGRPPAQTYMNGYYQVEGSHPLNEASLYGNHTRSPLYPPAQFQTMAQDQFQLSPEDSIYAKQENHSNLTAGEVVRGAARSNQFGGISRTNPLFSHDRDFLSAFPEATPGRSHASLTFTPINHEKEPGQNDHPVHLGHSYGNATTELRASVEADHASADKAASFAAAEGMWHSQPPSTGMDLAGDLESEDLQI